MFAWIVLKDSAEGMELLSGFDSYLDAEEFVKNQCDRADTAAVFVLLNATEVFLAQGAEKDGNSD